MYAGIPILASNCDPVERIMNETSAGYIYQYDNTDDLAGKLEILLARESKLKPTNGKEWVIKKYNRDTDKKELIAAYNRSDKTYDRQG